jgi:CRP/FNR family transcriptional regulator, cyclic AMP receptor protein
MLRAVSTLELERIGLFGGVSDAILAGMAERLAVRTVDAGEIVFAEGDRGREMFVVLDGEVELWKLSRGEEVRVATVHPGDWFGEMSLIDVLPRPWTARATTTGRLLALANEDLDELYRSDLKTYALFMMNVARQLSRKLRITEARLADSLR